MVKKKVTAEPIWNSDKEKVRMKKAIDTFSLMLTKQTEMIVKTNSDALEVLKLMSELL